MLDGSSCVFVAIDGTVAGALIIDDPIRPDAPWRDPTAPRRSNA